MPVKLPPEILTAMQLLKELNRYRIEAEKTRPSPKRSPSLQSRRYPIAYDSHQKNRRRGLWTLYNAAPEYRQQVAHQRLAALVAVEKLVKAGALLVEARVAVAAQMKSDGFPGSSSHSLQRWGSAVAGLKPKDWLPALLPGHAGGMPLKDIPADAWRAFVADYCEHPVATDCYRRLQTQAPEKGWQLPSLKTFQRRLKAKKAGAKSQFSE